MKGIQTNQLFFTGNGSPYGYRLGRFTPHGIVYTDTITPIVPVPHYPDCEVFCLEGLSEGTALLISKQQTELKYELIDLHGNLITTTPNVIFGQYFSDSDLYSSRYQDTMLVIGSITPTSTNDGSLLLQKVGTSGSSTSDHVSNVPGIELILNGPNPFYESIGFSCKTDHTKKLDIFVYNLRGQKIRVIFNGIFTSDKTDFIWDGKDERGRTVSSGVYFLRVCSGRESILHKLVKYK